MTDRRTTRESEAVRKTASSWIARRDAGLSAEEYSQLEAWRNADPSHAAALARYEKLWSHLDRPRTSGASPQLNRDLALLAARAQRRRRRMAGTAALAAVVLVTSAWMIRLRSPASATERSAVTVLVPERRVLADGTVVEYPADAEIAVDFASPKLRRVTLVHGEAHFQVAKNPARPFVVSASGVEVMAVGTAFSVQSGSSAVEVIVTEGRVAVGRSAQTAAAPDSTLVDAGQKFSLPPIPQAALSPEARAESISAAEIAQRLAWRNPRMEFSHTPLREVVSAINRYAVDRGGVQFTLADRALESMRLSGIFRVDDPTAFVGILEKGFAIEAERVGEQTIVLRKRR